MSGDEIFEACMDAQHEELVRRYGEDAMADIDGDKAHLIGANIHRNGMKRFKPFLDHCESIGIDVQGIHDELMSKKSHRHSGFDVVITVNAEYQRVQEKAAC